MAEVNTGGEETFTPPSDGSWIPKPRFDEAVQKERQRADELRTELQREREERIRLEERAKATPAATQQPEPTLTRAQLQSYVDNGTLTQEQMDEQITHPRDKNLKGEIGSMIDAKLSTFQQKSTLDTKLAAYRTRLPDIDTAGSDNRAKVQRCYTDLLSDGHPEDLRTQLLACRMAFGEPEKIEETTDNHRETNLDTGGGGDVGGVSQADGGPLEGLKPHVAAYYKKKVEETNRYPGGWKNKELQRELEYARR